MGMVCGNAAFSAAPAGDLLCKGDLLGEMKTQRAVFARLHRIDMR